MPKIGKSMTYLWHSRYIVKHMWSNITTKMGFENITSLAYPLYKKKSFSTCNILKEHKFHFFPCTYYIFHKINPIFQNIETIQHMINILATPFIQNLMIDYIMEWTFFILQTHVIKYQITGGKSRIYYVFFL
jgi:hypothetical protein